MAGSLAARGLKHPYEWGPIEDRHRDGKSHLLRDEGGTFHIGTFRDGQWYYSGSNYRLTDTPVEVAADA